MAEALDSRYVEGIPRDELHVQPFSRSLESVMSPLIPLRCIAAVGLVLASNWSLAAPGEDTIQLKNPVEHLQLPLNNNAASKGLETEGDGVPMHLRAKIARFEAKTFNEQTDGIYTDGDVSRIVGAQANRKTCIQDVGSNTAASGAGKYGPGTQQQIVVLRGDMVNICR